MRRPTTTAKALRRTPLIQAGRTNSPGVEGVPSVPAGAVPLIFLARRPAAKRASDAWARRFSSQLVIDDNLGISVRDWHGSSSLLKSLPLQFGYNHGAMEPTSAKASLYHRLGGYDVIAAVVDDLFEMLMSDPKFSRFGMGRSIDSHQRARQLLVDQLCQLAGGPSFYIGRDMKTSHAGLGITQEEWEINLDYTRQALKKNCVGQRESDEMIALFEQYRSEIVEVSATARQGQASGRG